VFYESWIFQTLFQSLLKEKREKCFINTCFSFFYHFQASMYRFMLDVHDFVKQHKLVDLVQYIVLIELKVFFVFIV